MLQDLRYRARAIFRRNVVEGELDDELQFHRERHIQKLVDSGLPHVEAARQAQLAFGGMQQIKEECREARGSSGFESVVRDLRYAFRVLAKSPSFTAVAILSLGLGIGANTAIFSVVNSLLLRPLPFPESNRLVRIWATDADSGSSHDVASWPDVADWANEARSVEHIAAYATRFYNLAGGDRPERIRGLRVSPAFFTALQVAPMAGRTLVPQDSQPGNDHVVLLTEGLWQRRFAANPGLLGKTIRLNDESYTVAGILPGAFVFPNEPAGLVVPLAPDPNRGHGFLNVLARLKPGSTLRQAQTELDTIANRLAHQYKADKGRGVRLVSLHESFVSGLKPALLIFLTAVVFVLAIACANVTNLFLARTAGRQREFVVRAALGARRGRLISQLLMESALVGLAGGAVGLLFAFAGVRALVALAQSNLPATAIERVSIDGPVLGFTFLVSLATGLLAGLAPALGASRPNVNETLKESSRTLSGSRGRNRLRSLLVVGEVALALVLLIGAGLTLKSFLLLKQVKPGLHPESILAMDFSLYGTRYGQTATRGAFVGEVLRRIKSLPAVRSASVVADIPLSGDSDSSSFQIEGRADPSPEKPRHASFNIIGPGYFQTLGIPLWEGRDFTDQDTGASTHVALINQEMARRFWPGQNPVGKRLSADGKDWFTIAGVAGDVRQLGPHAETQPEIYLSYLQDPVLWPHLSLLARTGSDPLTLAPQVERVVWSVDRDQPISNIRTMEQILFSATGQPRVIALLLAVFAALALLLAAVGIYGVMAYSVAQQTHDLGIRSALGASRGDVVRLVLRQGMTLALTGLAAGLGGAFALTRLMKSLLFGVGETDPATFAAVSAVLVTVAMLACYLPARRAAKADPIAALRYE